MVRNRLPLTAFMLAGGLGTRLRQVVSDRPKPMALVQGTPFLELVMKSLFSKGVTRFVLLVGHMAETIENYFAGWNTPCVNVLFSREHSPLGTGGAVKHAERFATDPTLLVNGDTYYDADLDDLLRLHQSKPAAATLCLMPVQDARRYGAVDVDASGKVLGFHEKRESNTGPGVINAGCSLLAEEFIHGLPHGRAFSMEREAFPKLAARGRLFGLCRKRAFFDIGTPESYGEFQRFVQDRQSTGER
jgi:D-glycero-alpha-D-manno-heptose 1-phosphate guanylyltransferase